MRAQAGEVRTIRIFLISQLVSGVAVPSIAGRLSNSLSVQDPSRENALFLSAKNRTEIVATIVMFAPGTATDPKVRQQDILAYASILDRKRKQSTVQIQSNVLMLQK